MSINRVNQRLSAFILKPEATVLAITGGWGAGKTHAWRASINRHSDHFAAHKARYAYVSLFGLKSISQVRTAIFIHTENASEAHRQASWSDINERWTTLGPPRVKRLYDRFRHAADAHPLSKGVALTIDAIAQKTADGLLLCLDDMERCNVDVHELLGLVADLRDNHSCKVAIIFNKEQLVSDAGHAYRLLREKVIDEEITFSRTPAEAVDCVISDSALWKQPILTVAKKVEITNIRILAIMDKTCRMIADATKSFSNNLRKDVYFAIAFLTYVRHISPTDVLKDCANWTNMLFSAEGEHPGFAFVRNALNRAELPSIENYWPALAKIVDCGAIDSNELMEQLAEAERVAEAQKIDSRFTTAWESFHNDLETDASELVEELFSSARDGLTTTVSVNNLDATIVLLRDLGHPIYATQLIDAYIDHFAGNHQAFDVRRLESRFGRSIADTEFRERLEEQRMASISPFTLINALEAFDQSRYTDSRVADAMRTSTQQEIYEFIVSLKGNSLRTAISMLTNVPDTVDAGDASALAMEALRSIARRSRLNEIQLRRFNVNLD